MPAPAPAPAPACVVMNDRLGGGSLRSVSGIVRAALSSLVSAIMTCPPSSELEDPPLPGVDHIRYTTIM